MIDSIKSKQHTLFGQNAVLKVAPVSRKAPISAGPQVVSLAKVACAEPEY